MRAANVVLAILAVLLLAGCAAQPAAPGADLPGFFTGFWHGLIAPFSLIGSFFSSVRMYAYPNGGVIYDLGFLLGLATLGSGGAFNISIIRR